MNNFRHIASPEIPKLIRIDTPEGRRYSTPSGNFYPSITTVLGDTLPKDGLDQWRKRVGEKEADKISAKAAYRGGEVHSLLEKYVANDPDWAKNSNPFHKATAYSVIPILNSRMNDVILQEVQLYSDKLKIAGTVDCIAHWDGKLAAIDYKTSMRAKKKSHIEGYYLQCAFYALAYYELTGTPIHNFTIVIACDNDPPQIFTGKTKNHIERLIQLRKRYKKLKGF